MILDNLELCLDLAISMDGLAGDAVVADLSMMSEHGTWIRMFGNCSLISFNAQGAVALIFWRGEDGDE